MYQSPPLRPSRPLPIYEDHPQPIFPTIPQPSFQTRPPSLVESCSNFSFNPKTPSVAVRDYTITIDDDPSSSPDDSGISKPSPSSVNNLKASIRDRLVLRLAKVSNWIHDWTPFLLVVSYFVFSVCLYLVCSQQMISIFWFIYLMTNFYIAGGTVLEAFMSISPCRDARKALTEVHSKNWKFPTPDNEILVLDLIIVAYLPNEKDIIMDRVRYALDKIMYPEEKIRINVVYNTPKPIEPLETELHQLAEQVPRLRIHKVVKSTSKAENLNHFLSLDTGADIIAIFDCDHYCHPYGPRWAAERFMTSKDIDIVQGRCIVFNAQESFYSAMISVEFDKIYASSHPGRAALWDFGLFTGSNGYWRAELLKDLKMDGDMLTEDIDSALRAVSRGAHAVHDMNVNSYELAPTTFQAFWKQRLRWAQGWCQASFKHTKLAYLRSQKDKYRGFIARFGILSLLLIREFSYYLLTQFTCLVLSFLIARFPRTGSELFQVVFFQYPVCQWFFIISVVCLFITLWITIMMHSEFTNKRMILLFCIIYPFYLVLNAIIGLYGHARQVVGYSSWNPTARN